MLQWKKEDASGALSTDGTAQSRIWTEFKNALSL